MTSLVPMYGRSAEVDQEGMRRKDELGRIWWAWRRGDWTAAESGGRVDWRWWMRGLWAMREWSAAVEMKIGEVLT